MKADESLALIAYRLERSRESLRAAEIMFENSMLTFSMNRVYYAMFYAVQALLVSRKVLSLRGGLLPTKQSHNPQINHEIASSLRSSQ